MRQSQADPPEYCSQPSLVAPYSSSILRTSSGNPLGISHIVSSPFTHNILFIILRFSLFLILTNVKAGFEVVTTAGVSSACTISCDGTLTLMGRLMEVINWNRLGLVSCVHCLGLTNWCNIGGWDVRVGDRSNCYTSSYTSHQPSPLPPPPPSSPSCCSPPPP